MADTNFLYLFRGGAAADLSPEEMQRNMQKWAGWVKGLADEGRMRGGDPLDNTAGKVVTNYGKSITDGPYAEAKDVVGGYVIVAARDLAHAAEMARGCPIFEYGGSVEVRTIRPMMA